MNKSDSQHSNLSSKVLARFGGRRELYEKSLISFTKLLPDEWQSFDKAVENSEETRREIHKIKGVAGNLAEDDVYRYASDFEASIKSNHPDRALYEQLIASCNESKERILSRAKNSEVKLKLSGSADEFRNLINRLRNALENYDPAESSEVVESLRKKNWGYADSVRLTKLCELAEDYEFDAALCELELINL